MQICATILIASAASQERLAAQREEVRRRAAEIDDALAELDEHRREAEHREKLLAAEDERLADALSQVCPVQMLRVTQIYLHRLQKLQASSIG